jgi:ABC-2 type transport system permease protein
MSELTLRAGTPLTDLTVMTGRGLRLARRNVDAVVMGLMLPVMLLVVFVYLWGGAIRSPIAYVDYVVPGVILIAVSIGAASTAISVNKDMGSGVIDRFRSMDVSGAAVLSGHVVASLARNAASTALVLAVAFGIGFRSGAGPAGWLAAIAILSLFVLALSWLAAAVGLLTGSVEAAGAFTFFALFFTYPSSAMVPVATMPSWVRGFAGNQPMTAVVDSVRSLLLGQPVGSSLWRAALWCAGILAVSVTAAAVLFQRRTD